MQTDKLKDNDGIGISDYLRTLPPTEHRNACDEIAEWCGLKQWCEMEEPFQTYVGWALEGENGSYGNGRSFQLEIMGSGVSLMQGFDRRNRRKIKTFELGSVVTLRPNEARVTFKTYGEISSMASDRGKVRELVTIEHDEAIEPPKGNSPQQGGKRKR